MHIFGPASHMRLLSPMFDVFPDNLFASFQHRTVSLLRSKKNYEASL